MIKGGPTSHFQVQLLGLDVLVVYDQVFGLAVLSSAKQGVKAQDLSHCSLTAIHSSLKQNFNLNEMLMDLYGEDLQYKEYEMATLTASATVRHS